MPAVSAVLVVVLIRLAAPVVVLPGELQLPVGRAVLRLVLAVPEVAVPMQLLLAGLAQALAVLAVLVHPVLEVLVARLPVVLGVRGRAIPVVVAVAVAPLIRPVLEVPVMIFLLGVLTLAALVLVLAEVEADQAARSQPEPLLTSTAPADFLVAVVGAPELRERRQRQ
jgi:hypothetical protein